MMMKIANMMKRLKKDEKGFTLIELMVVIAVLGIMAALIIPQFANVSAKAQLANAESTAQSVASAAAMFYAENQAAPAADGSNLTPYLSNIASISADYTVAITATTVTVTGNVTGPKKIPASATASATYR